MKWLKVGAVVFMSVAFTTLAIDAADTLSGSKSTLLGQLISTESSACPDGMLAVPVAQSFDCVDEYEATASPDCPYPQPNNTQQSSSNISNPDCKSISEKDEIPWRFVTREQAATACLRSGKRLITSAEWHLIAAGTPDTKVCNIESSGAKPSGENELCKSAVGVKDTIGNVWEWTSDDVIEGKYQGREVPESGYVAQVDSGGFPTMTNNTASGLFFEDYFWSEREGAYGVLRGGFYGSKSDAGMYSTHAQTLPTVSGTAIGFRCVI